MSCNFSLFYCFLDLSCGECNVISLYVLCDLFMDLFVLCVACLSVFVNCLMKQFIIYVGVVVILLFIVIEVLSVCGGALLDIPCMVFQIMCVCFAWVSAISMMFVKIISAVCMLVGIVV